MKTKIAFTFVAVALLASAGMAQNALTVDAGCAMNGTNFGMRTTLVGGDAQVVYVQDDTPAEETIYRASFWFNPNALSMPATSRFPIFLGRDDANGNVLRLQVHRNAQNNKYRLRLQVKKNNGDWANAREFDTTGTQFLPLGDGVVEKLVTVEVVYGGTGDAMIRLIANGKTFSKTNFPSSNWDIGHVRMGATRALNVSTFNGSMCFDEFESFRTLAP